MLLRFVVQRFGAGATGGSEALARRLAREMVDRGHRVQVVTSTADDYTTWHEGHAPGVSDDDGVEVLRLAPARRRDPATFARLDQRVAGIGRSPSPTVQADWLRLQGPWLRGLVDVLTRPVDVTVFFTYLYAPAVVGPAAAASVGPVVLVPTAHDEPQLALSIYDRAVDHADVVVALTPEEARLLRRRFRRLGRVEVCGAGVDPLAAAGASRSGPPAGHPPHLVVLGRLDPSKATGEAIARFCAYRDRRPDEPLRLVVVGSGGGVFDPGRDDVVVTGRVSDAERDALLASAVALVQPSHRESLSLALLEAWSVGTPAIVQGRCAVTSGHVERSGGGLVYRDQLDFEAAVDVLVHHPEVARGLGAAGRRHVAAHHRWDLVGDRYEALFAELAAGGGRRAVRPDRRVAPRRG